jgi:hypothetical protein
VYRGVGKIFDFAFQLDSTTCRRLDGRRGCLSVVVILSCLAVSGSVSILLICSNAIFRGMSCIVQFFIYFILVAIPHLYSTQLQVFVFITASITYLSKFFLQFFLLYHLLLLKIIEIKGSKEIEIKHFDGIVRKCCPLAQEVFILCAKVLMTTFLLIIMYLTLSELNFLDGENSFDLNTFLMYIFVLLTPGILEILFFESNADKVERMHHELDAQVTYIDNLQSSQENSDEDSGIESATLKCTCKCNKACVTFICLCFCGCLECSCHDNGHCKYCYTLQEKEDKNGRFYEATYFTLNDKNNETRGYENINMD